jgi:transcription initiation factor TFIIH subunit 2
VAAEVYICRRIADDTGGTYGVALGEGHLRELMLALAPPPPASAALAGAELVAMGFPRRDAEDLSAVVYAGKDCGLRAGCYSCPRCGAKSPELPCGCHVCGLTLISSPHLARSYHHLFPVQPFDEVEAAELAQARARARVGAERGGGGPQCAAKQRAAPLPPSHGLTRAPPAPSE